MLAGFWWFVVLIFFSSVANIKANEGKQRVKSWVGEECCVSLSGELTDLCCMQESDVSSKESIILMLLLNLLKWNDSAF